jgi:hypothetical protein
MKSGGFFQNTLQLGGGNKYTLEDREVSGRVETKIFVFAFSRKFIFVFAKIFKRKYTKITKLSQHFRESFRYFCIVSFFAKMQNFFLQNIKILGHSSMVYLQKKKQLKVHDTNFFSKVVKLSF